ncbi:MAG: YceH family protein [Planctomycetota bacterium]|nr:YceH family protein [Planctomycetota bacterium]MDA1177722.1 YceH family protein [Planctomycetota bacterium]
MSIDTTTSSPSAPRWTALPPKARRVIGVMIEKAKTTPDAYPLTLNSLTTGCNQKSNRDPQMELDSDDVEACLEDLRGFGAVVEVAGSGRVSKFRHLLYDWLGVDKVELAVMGELLLRGAQTVGELRGRAARMEPIADLSALRPVIQSLIQKRLVLSLSSEGRGQIVTHNLYPSDELARLKSKVTAQELATVPETSVAPPVLPIAASSPARASAPQVVSSAASDTRVDAELHWLRNEIESLRKDLTRLQQDISDLWKSLQ